MTVENTCLAVIGVVLLAAGVADGQTNLVPITLRDCVDQALKQNLLVQADEVSWEIAKWNVRRERGAFEPDLVASTTREENERRNTVEQSRSQLSPFFSERNTRYEASVGGLFYSGAQYQLGYSLADLANNLTNVTFQNEFDSQFQSFLGVSVSQPLLKGAGVKAAMSAVRLAISQQDAAYQDLRSRWMDTVSRTEAAYWDLVLAQDIHRYRTDSLRIAGAILEDNRARVREGKMSQIEVLQAEAGVAGRAVRLHEAEQLLVGARRRLLTLFANADADGWGALTASDRPVVAPAQYTFEEGMRMATALQPEYLRRRHELGAEDIRLQFAKNQRWPQVDLVGSYGFNGLGETTEESWQDIEDQESAAWSIGLRATVGLGGGKQERAELAATTLRRRRAILNLKEAEIEIANALQSHLQELEIVESSITNYARVVEYSQALLDAELARLKEGRSNSRQVLEVEDDLLTARTEQSRSENVFQTLLVQSRLTIGATLMEYGLDTYESEDSADGDLSTPVPMSYPPESTAARIPAEPRRPPDELEKPVPR